ncbi:pilus assembly protein [Mumia sp. ZJ1417]|uniref:TadE family protein n=1 Tax=unclassified Mumia TaxID=2621872 RepID=UPI001422E0CD|nr:MULTISPECIES: TadE family protein [unclassified Mumia]QMW66708.1 pilus assembly protein [Mumia sp. ZJ1417]
MAAGGGRERGMVTAETAMVLPFLVALAFALVWVVSLGVTHVRLVDAAREGARMAARGDDREDVVDAVEQMAPEGATVEVVDGEDEATTRVIVRLRSRVELPVVRQLAVDLDASAVSADESASRP